ncbi:DnaJ domain-containing protein [Sphingomonas sp. LB-2]|uniref:DnaJ domain-containing protein n=1 Tax=Sphingomonas caeni TaxID=2984949 RepID=UPI00222E8611|nr:DnaJ domain-containing protein [Sphingomonas caeni]MCW3845971.1 DnaJ domain-containing protein [Sphingomonas caeni]
MNYYEILGVDRGAEQEVIDAAFRAMMRRYHPDIFAGPKAEAERRAKQLNEAYAILRNPERRRAYDATLGPAAPPPPPVYEILPNPDSGRAIPRVTLMLAGIAAVAAVAFIIYQNQPETPIPVAPVAVSDAAALPAEPRTAPAPIPSPALTPTPTAIAGCRGIACRVMTPFGWGGIEAGVTTDSAQQASGMKIRDNGHYTEAGDGTCLAYEVIGGPKNLQMLVERGEVTTVEAYLDPAAPVFMTDRGVKLGDPESAVRKAYKGLKQLPDIYSEPPDKKLFHYEPGGERGIKFSINGGKVTGISVGARSIEYVEGCL